MMRLAIFVRYPRPGHTKTRLIAALGSRGAARLGHAMALRTLQAARAFRQQSGAGLEVRFTGATREQFTALYGHDLDYTDQGGGDLGARLTRALAPGATIAIGSDCPSLDAGTLLAAAQALNRADVVLGPAADGGYYLIALRQPAPELLTDIPWSTPAVLARTVAAARQAGLRVAYLPEHRDVDEPTDLAGAADLLPARAGYHPRRITLTGATGSLGLRFTEMLLARDPAVQISILVRATSPRRPSPAFQRILNRYSPRIELIEGDLSELHRLSRFQRTRLGQADGGLWHFAASTQLLCHSAEAESAVWRTNVTGTRHVLELLQSCRHPGPLLHISTAYVCGRRAGVICENDLDRGCGYRNTYEASKAQAEQLVREALGAGMVGAIFRPSVVVGPPAASSGLRVVDALADTLATALRDGVAALTLRATPESGINAIDRDWSLRRMLELAADPAGRTYHLTARHALQMGDVAQLAGQLRPGFALTLDPSLSPLALQGRSRRIDRALSPYRDYLQAAPSLLFDRIHTELYAEGAGEEELDLAPRLRAGLGSPGIEVPTAAWPSAVAE